MCALLIYAFCWSSPKDVSVPITFLYWEGQIPSTIAAIAQRADPERINTNMKAQEGQRYYSNNFIFSNMSPYIESTLMFGALAFGAPHLLAWNFIFPTPVERIIWRATSLYCTFAGVIMFGLSIRRTIFVPGVAGTMGIYILARLFLIVEMFRTLLFLPPSAYVATWTANVPMFG